MEIDVSNWDAIPVFTLCCLYLTASHGKWDKSRGKPGRHKEEVGLKQYYAVHISAVLWKSDG